MLGCQYFLLLFWLWYPLIVRNELVSFVSSDKFFDEYLSQYQFAKLQECKVTGNTVANFPFNESVPVNPHPQPHLPSPCLCKIKMRGSGKMVWIDALRTTRYRLILMLCCDVLMFVVKQGVPSNGDLEWLYPSCLLYGKYFLRAFRSIANWRYKWFVTKSVFLAMAIFLTGWKKRKQDIFCSRMWMCIFRAKWCTVGMHNAVAPIGLETNSPKTFH